MPIVYVMGIGAVPYSVGAELMDGSVDSPETNDFARLVIHCDVC